MRYFGLKYFIFGPVDRSKPCAFFQECKKFVIAEHFLKLLLTRFRRGRICLRIDKKRRLKIVQVDVRCKHRRCLKD